jgi:dTDP-4-dehydrorhamnose reductase
VRLLLFGANGQVGTEIRRRAASLGHDFVALDRDAADLSLQGAAAAAIERTACDAVVNAAAYTAVDKAETEADAAFAANANAPAEMARAAAAKGVPFIHLSTDYVFDGASASPYLETDATNPLGVYGRSKLEGEEGVAAAGGAHIILRLSWVFSAHGTNFVKTMLRLAADRDTVRVVADQIGKPTPAAAAADAAMTVAAALARDPGKFGIYHFAGDDEVSWADFAEAIFAASGSKTRVERIATAEYPTAAKRPAYSVLSTNKIEAKFGIKPANWRAGLIDVVRELKEAKR